MRQHRLASPPLRAQAVEVVGELPIECAEQGQRSVGTTLGTESPKFEYVAEDCRDGIGWIDCGG